MSIQASTRMRLAGVALMAAVAAGCGGGGGGDPVASAPPPAGPPAPPPIPAVLTWESFAPASVVIGQPDAGQGGVPASPAPLDRLRFPSGSAGVTSGGTLFVANSGSIRAFANYDTASGPTAQLSLPGAGRAASVHGGKLVAVADNRVEIYNQPPTSADASPDVMLGGPAECAATRFDTPQHAFITPMGKLIVADTNNHRVLIWNQVPEAGDDADFVIGQSLMEDSCAPNAGRSVASEQTMLHPASVWSDDTRLIVVDGGNHRVLIWDSFPAGDFRPATRVLGQENFSDSLPNRADTGVTSGSLSSPTSVDVRDSGQMVVADSGNNRVLIWDSFPTESGQAATQLLGQTEFSFSAANAGGSPSASSLRKPVGVAFHGRNLIVVDQENHRVLVFPASN